MPSWWQCPSETSCCRAGQLSRESCCMTHLALPAQSGYPHPNHPQLQNSAFLPRAITLSTIHELRAQNSPSGRLPARNTAIVPTGRGDGGTRVRPPCSTGDGWRLRGIRRAPHACELSPMTPFPAHSLSPRPQEVKDIKIKADRRWDLRHTPALSVRPLAGWEGVRPAPSPRRPDGPEGQCAPTWRGAPR